MATKPHHIFFISLHLQFKALNKDPRYMIGWGGFPLGSRPTLWDG